MDPTLQLYIYAVSQEELCTYVWVYVKTAKMKDYD